MTEQPPKIKFIALDATLEGSDIVMFRLSNGDTLKCRVVPDRIGISEIKNPDGSPLYNMSVSLQTLIIPKSKEFYLDDPRNLNQLPAPSKPAQHIM